MTYDAQPVWENAAVTSQIALIREGGDVHGEDEKLSEILRYVAWWRPNWNADLADPLDFFDTFASDSPFNTTGFQSAEFTALLQALRKAEQPSEIARLSLAAERALLAQQPIIPLFHYTSKHLVSSELLGFEGNPLDHHPSRVLRWRRTAP